MDKKLIDKKLLAVCVLTVSAVGLMIANFVAPRAEASTTITANGFQVATGKVVNGGEGLYIVDSRSGNMAIFIYDNTTRSLRPAAMRPVSDAMIVK